MLSIIINSALLTIAAMAVLQLMSNMKSDLSMIVAKARGRRR